MVVIVTWLPLAKVPPHADAGTVKYGEDVLGLTGANVLLRLPVPRGPRKADVQVNAVADVKANVTVSRMAPA